MAWPSNRSAPKRAALVELPLPDGGRAKVFLEVFARRPKLVVFGAGHIAMALVPLAKAVGFRTMVADAREAFLTRERFPEADELVLDWPEAAFARIGIDRATYICLSLTIPNSMTRPSRSDSGRPLATSGRSGRARPRRRDGRACGKRVSGMPTSTGSMDRLDSIWAADPPPR